MKQIRNLLKLIIAAVLLAGMFAACEGPMGPRGYQGEQGDPGPGSVVNWEGYKEGIACATCHSADTDTVYYVAARVVQWEQSKHGNGGEYVENSSTCSPCHTTEGFVQQELGLTVTSHPNSTPPGCFACHSPHSLGDFSLRTTDPVTMLSGIAGQPDFVFDYGKGNLCSSCHKPRSISPKPDPTKTANTDTIVINSIRWYQHYGVQGSMLAGLNGFEFQGYTYDNSYHTDAQLIKDEGCVVCHMAQEERNPAGGHTMWLDYEGSQMLAGCNTVGCHNGNLEDLDYHGVQTEITGLLDSLANMLLAREWIFENEGSYSVNSGSGSPRNGKLYISPAYLSGAIYNFFFVEHDLSEGVHNTRYTRELLESSIDVLNEE